MLTRTGVALLTTAVVLFTAGAGLGNYLLLAVAALPLFSLLTAASLERPEVTVERRLDPASPRVGDEVTCTLRVRAPRGVGLVEVHQAIPDIFTLEEGSNIRLLTKGLGPLDAEVSFRFRATKRGAYEVPPVRVEVADAAGLLAPLDAAHCGDLELEVRPALGRVRRLRGLRGVATRLFPESDAARLGVQTNEFRDIREYAWGDPPRSVNWKASAKRLSAAHPDMGGATPLVNEYEHEGKKSVWLFVDAAAYMEVGTAVENALEHTVQAATAVAQHFLDRGYRLGAYIYNAKGQEPLYADAGQQQLLKVTRELTTVRPAAPEEGLPAAVERCRVHLVTGRPLVVVLTRLSADADRALAGVHRIRRLSGHRRQRLPVLMVSCRADGLLGLADDGVSPDALAAAGALERAAVSRARRAGCTVLSWDPRRHPFHALLLKGGF